MWPICVYNIRIHFSEHVHMYDRYTHIACMYLCMYVYNKESDYPMSHIVVCPSLSRNCSVTRTFIFVQGKIIHVCTLWLYINSCMCVCIYIIMIILLWFGKIARAKAQYFMDANTIFNEFLIKWSPPCWQRFACVGQCHGCLNPESTNFWSSDARSHADTIFIQPLTESSSPVCVRHCDGPGPPRG